MNETLWNRILESVADKGRELLNLGASSARHEMAYLCHALLSGAGEASGTALAREVVRTYQDMDETQRTAFMGLLADSFAPCHETILTTADAYHADPSLENLLALSAAVEPPRQELFRRINQAPRGTEMLVNVRRHLLGKLRDKPQLRAVDSDLKHLFRSWFNPGFLELNRIDWNSRASILEKLINYEAVHAIQGWGDLRRRLASDRRCFAFFHPTLPDEPLIFVEVALVKGMSSAAHPLLDLEGPVLDAKQADSAIFFSINNCQEGLKGISFGNFLIKQVMARLMIELPWLTLFATFSPMPRFAATLKKADSEGNPFTRARIRRLLGDMAAPLCEASAIDEPLDALLKCLESPEQHREIIGPALERLALAYLAVAQKAGSTVDPVAQFHLYNGARLERINLFADSSEERQQASFGVMVNYLYRADEVESNHEKFVATGTVALSKTLEKERKRLLPLWQD